MSRHRRSLVCMLFAILALAVIAPMARALAEQPADPARPIAAAGVARGMALLTLAQADEEAFGPFLVLVTDDGFLPREIVAPADVPITLQLENRGELVHNLTVDSPDLELDLIAEPGATDSATVTLPAGRYDFRSSQLMDIGDAFAGTVIARAIAGAPSPAGSSDPDSSTAKTADRGDPTPPAPADASPTPAAIDATLVTDASPVTGDATPIREIPVFGADSADCADLLDYEKAYENALVQAMIGSPGVFEIFTKYQDVDQDAMFAQMTPEEAQVYGDYFTAVAAELETQTPPEIVAVWHQAQIDTFRILGDLFPELVGGASILTAALRGPEIQKLQKASEAANAAVADICPDFAEWSKDKAI